MENWIHTNDRCTMIEMPSRSVGPFQLHDHTPVRVTETTAFDSHCLLGSIKSDRSDNKPLPTNDDNQKSITSREQIARTTFNTTIRIPSTMPHSDDDSSDSDDSVIETNENAEPTLDKEDKLVDTTQDESVSSNDEDDDDHGGTSETQDITVELVNEQEQEEEQDEDDLVASKDTNAEPESVAETNSESTSDPTSAVNDVPVSRSSFTVQADSKPVASEKSLSASQHKQADDDSAFSKLGIVDKFTEPLLKDKLHNPSTEHQGRRHSATIDKFNDPLLKVKIKNPSMDHQGQESAYSRSSVLDKFTEPLLKDKVKNPTKDYAGVRHSAGGMDKFTAPQIKGSVKAPPRHEWGKAPPKGKFEWVQVGGKWTKKYEEESPVSELIAATEE